MKLDVKVEHKPERPSGLMTQSVRGVKAYLEVVKGNTISFKDLPDVIPVGKNIKLIRSTKRGFREDCYYTTSRTDCSCPSRAFHPTNPCKHMKSFDGTQKTLKESLGTWDGNAKGPTLTNVICGICGKSYLESAVDIIGIEKNSSGKDVVVFRCPECLKATSSFRRN
jgi:hypothetical protein